MTKQAAKVDLWLKDIAPSHTLRTWYAHDPKRWTEFQKRYAAEIKEQREILTQLRCAAKQGPLTLLFSSREEILNNAAALKKMLSSRAR